jgi:hypothetical protein
MECSICFSEITAATGKVELSCSHPFHFSCLSSWFVKQACQGSNQTCPLCRHESNEFEKIPDNDAQGEDEDEDEDEDEEEEEGSPLISWASERATGKFQTLKATMSPEDLQTHAAILIKACWRGYQDRLLYAELLENKRFIEESLREIEENHRQIASAQKYLALDCQTKRFLKSLIGLSRYEVKNLAARKIQFLWRSWLSSRPPAKVRPWQEISPGVWQKTVLNPEQDEPTIFVGLTPPLAEVI